MNFADDTFNLAMIYEEIGKLDRAKLLYTESLRITEALSGQGPEYAERLTNLAVVLGKMGKPSSALGMFTRVVNLKRERFGIDSPEEGHALQNYANCLFDQDKFDLALEIYQRVLQIREPNKDIYYVDSLNACGNCLVAMGKPETAEGYFIHALDTTAAISGEETEDYINELLSYADFLCENEFDNAESRVNQAIKCCNKALKLYNRMYEGQNMLHAEAINTVAEGLAKAGEVKKALSHKLRALDLMKKDVGGNHLYFANIYREIAVGYHKLGDKANAIKNMRRSLRIKDSIVGRLNDNYVRDLLALCLFYLEEPDYKRLAVLLKSVLKGVDFNDESTPPYYRGLRELHFLTNEMSKLQQSVNGEYNGQTFSDDLKKIDALSQLFKLVSENLN
jgi:tetratricopeptide (TPR) repeat protein